jgi:hypothetical protein
LGSYSRRYGPCVLQLLLAKYSVRVPLNQISIPTQKQRCSYRGCGIFMRNSEGRGWRPVPVVCAISDSQFQAFKGPGLPEMPDPAASSVMVTQKGARIMALSRSGQSVYAPDVAQAEDELCLFSKHDSALILRKEDDGSWELVGNAYVLTTEEKKRRRPRTQLRSFKYCLPDYDMFPPPTSDPKERFLIRMSAITLQWVTRV